MIVSDWVCMLVGVALAGCYLLGYCHGFAKGHDAREGSDG